MTKTVALLTAIFFLCFFRLTIEGVGAFIALDVVSFLYFLRNFEKLKNFSFIFIILIIATLVAFVGFLFNSTNEFPFIFRLLLIFLDAIFLFYYSINKKIPGHFLIISAFVGFFTGFLFYLIFPESITDLLYLSSVKAWIATFPALLTVYFLLQNRNKAALVVGLLTVLISLNPDSVSRTLLIQSTLLTLYAVWRLDKIVAPPLLLLAISLLLFTTYDWSYEVVGQHDSSNTMRMTMITQIFDFSPFEMVFGRGVELWRVTSLNYLYQLPGADEFFETANPHFFPAELVIRGGLLLLASVLAMLLIPMRKSSNAVIAIIMMIGTFTTTNTGVERIYISLALYVAFMGNAALTRWKTR